MKFIGGPLLPRYNNGKKEKQVSVLFCNIDLHVVYNHKVAGTYTSR